MVHVCVKQDKRIIDMNYALIIAGGSGNRMGQDIPKQMATRAGVPTPCQVDAIPYPIAIEDGLGNYLEQMEHTT